MIYKEHLSKDPVMAKLIAEHGEITITPSGDYFADLVSQIVGQQLSVKVAEVINRRVVDLMGGEVTPQNIQKLTDEQLRGAGLSTGKTKYVRNIAEAVENRMLDFDNLPVQDEDVIALLTQVKGIGRWTAEMFLIFSLARPDVFSHGDLGLKNAIGKLYGEKTRAEVEELAQTWSPFRSYASLYLWQSLDNTPKS